MPCKHRAPVPASAYVCCVAIPALNPFQRYVPHYGSFQMRAAALCAQPAAPRFIRLTGFGGTSCGSVGLELELFTLALIPSLLIHHID
jgi:hypothetical protein